MSTVTILSLLEMSDLQQGNRRDKFPLGRKHSQAEENPLHAMKHTERWNKNTEGKKLWELSRNK